MGKKSSAKRQKPNPGLNGAAAPPQTSAAEAIILPHSPSGTAPHTKSAVDIAAKRIQRMWRKSDPTLRLVANFLSCGPTIDHVKSIR